MAKILPSRYRNPFEVTPVLDMLGPDSLIVESPTIERRIGVGELEKRLESTPLERVQALSGFPLGPV
jgi:hypothetical protein